MSRSGPSASRAAATRSTTASSSAGRGDRASSRPVAFILTAVKPASTWRGDLVGELGRARRRRPRRRPGPGRAPAHRAARAPGRRTLAGDVPQRLVDAGDGAGEHRPAAVEAALGQHLPVVLDAQRVLADQVLGEHPRRRPARSRRGPRPRVRPSRRSPRRSRSRQNSHRGGDEERLDRLDLHALAAFHLVVCTTVDSSWTASASNCPWRPAPPPGRRPRPRPARRGGWARSRHLSLCARARRGSASAGLDHHLHALQQFVVGGGSSARWNARSASDDRLGQHGRVLHRAARHAARPGRRRCRGRRRAGSGRFDDGAHLARGWTGTRCRCATRTASAARRRRAGSRTRGRHEGAAFLPRVHEALGRQHPDGLAHHGEADVELVAAARRGRSPRQGRAAGDDRLPQMVDHLPVHASAYGHLLSALPWSRAPRRSLMPSPPRRSIRRRP